MQAASIRYAYLLELIDREVARPTVTEVLDRAARRSERASASASAAVAAARNARTADQGRHSA